MCSSVPPGMSLPTGFCTSYVLVCIRMYSVCIRLYRLGCRFPQVFAVRLYSFVLSPRLADIILLGDGRSTKVQKRANVLRALYWVPVGQTALLRHAPLPRLPFLCPNLLYQRCSVPHRLYSVCVRLCSFVLRLFPVCTPFVRRSYRSGC